MVVALAAVIAAVAVAEAGISLVTRWLSSTIGEGLILDLRTAVFDHVQRMPVAFFTRTRTGALVSRLGNDVMGAQRAFSDTFSGVITNIVTLTLTLVVMLRISWQVTLLSLVLMPLFLLPARWIGRTMARLSREAAIHNATMNTQMTERFSAPGATLVKLFGSPATESREFEVRAGTRPRHRRAHRDAAVRLHELADADVGARAGPGVRARRRAGDRRASADGRDRVAGPAADPAVQRR